ncbi:hypothetical protein CLAFUW4_05316 [Fulvia fulva]|uniref:RRM domain-containing protein n=1 Tax=Passalora fulva TaxID=5499 RepID=A0A9Q8LIU6_PASFU|nr:uncharacterized protein CLAFUR5_05463 [Fulvia fulva]KAK4623988.1 hypothetical protein CLAFUR4_05310 [Fulvia fulva]KAK4625468.1 hypothetical protein CLAFUR0_05317 [Fulvia fulva]UJO18289.1 hypothetical protein CLAFUR5_05463 [Fulvia fulva]WPV15440.1 hypothetical protein CLAFUW4_05316 [Fulvia fulva]WPV29786.1 hypothetical protein CLAFUW7_05315 [Fulvia fulva]
MADELARAYFEKLKAAEQQIFELQLELAGKNKSTSSATTTVANNHEVLAHRIQLLEQDNARLRNADAYNEQLEDEEDEDEDDDGEQVIMCDCGIDLLAQLQENKALQNELKTERLQFQVIQGQVKHLRKQVSERDERIVNLTAQESAVQIKKEQTGTPAENPAKRKRTDMDIDQHPRTANISSQTDRALAAQDYRQHPARAEWTGHTLPPRPGGGLPLPTPAQTPNPMAPGNPFYASPTPLLPPSVGLFASCPAPGPPSQSVPIQTNAARGTSIPAKVTRPPQMSPFARAPSRDPIPITHPDRVKLVRDESRVLRKVLESPTSPQDSSTDSESDTLTDVKVDGFPLSWRLQKIKQYLTKQRLSPLSVRRPQMPFAHMTFSDRQDATRAMDRLNGQSIEGHILAGSLANG